MKLCVHVLFLCVFPSLASVTQEDHPIEKVVNMLKGLMAKSELEGKAEAVSYTKFEYWCKNSKKTLEDTIAEEKEKVDTLTSKVEAKTKEIASLEKQISELEEQIGNMEKKGEEAEAERKESRALFEKADTDYKATIKAVGEAISALKEAKTGTATMLQVVLAKRHLQGNLALIEASATGEQLATLNAFVNEDFSMDAGSPAPVPSDILAAGDYGKHVKKNRFKSNSVIELLKQLKTKFENDVLQATKEETNAADAYTLAKQARDTAIEAAKATKEEKEAVKASTESDLAEAKADLESTQADLVADSETLEATTKTCDIKASEWKERSQIRTAEIEAMKAAIKILSEVGGVQTEAPSNPIPPPSPVPEESNGLSFLQSTDPKMKAVKLLRLKARTMHSRALERLAQEIDAHLSGPFDELNQMIQKMIFRLMAEQKDEDDHKNWCDKEVSKTNTSKTDKEDKVEELTLKIDAAKATVTKLTEDIESAHEMINSIVEHVKEATEIREIGKAENAKALKDAVDAQTAISNAIAVLEDFYKESGMIEKESYEFVQEPISLPEAPSTWDSGYTGVTDPKNQPSGILVVLETCSEDFAKMEADTKAQEAADQKEYDDDMSACSIEKARRTEEVEVKGNEKERLVDKIGGLTATKKQTSSELDAVLQYLKDLEPACIAGDSDYETRKEARATEIDALQEAQQILADAYKEVPKAAAAPAATFLQQRQRSPE